MNGNYKLSIALSPKIAQFSINQSEYIYFDETDNAISGISENKLYFDSDFGLALYSNKLTAGIGINQLFQPNLSVGENTSEENKLYRKFFLHADYKVNLNDNLKLQPSVRLAYTEYGLFYETGARLQLKDLVWIGASYKSYPALSFMFGVNYKKIQFGYAFDYNLKFISGYSARTHEIVLNYVFGYTSVSSAK